MDGETRRIITICSTKGGVGKTTLTAALGGLLADCGWRVLLVDADVQPTLSGYFQIRTRAEHGLTRLVQTGNIADCLSTTESGCDLVYSDDPQGRLQNWILHTPDGRFRLRRALKDLNTYDAILIDTQGAVGPLQDAAVLAADLLLSPIPPEMLTAREFARGTLEMLARLDEFGFLGITPAPLLGVLYCMDHTVDARRVAARLREDVGELSAGSRAIRLASTSVPRAVAFREAATARVPAHRMSVAAEACVRALAAELIGNRILDRTEQETPQETPV